MRLWKRAVVHVPAGPALSGVEERRLTAEAFAERARVQVAFDVTVARIARDAATPALGKGAPRSSRAAH